MDMSKRTLDELRKEINGKQVVYVDGNIKVDALMICPPEGEQVSVKPYGYEPERLLELIEKGGYEGWTVEEISAPEFCFASYKIKGKDPKKMKVLERLANIPDGGTHCFEEIIKGSEEHGPEGTILPSSPSCPYG